jgi:hypothetical protein
LNGFDEVESNSKEYFIVSKYWRAFRRNVLAFQNAGEHFEGKNIVGEINNKKVENILNSFQNEKLFKSY